MTALLEPGLALQWDGRDVHLLKVHINSPNKVNENVNYCAVLTSKLIKLALINKEEDFGFFFFFGKIISVCILQSKNYSAQLYGKFSRHRIY